MPSSSSPPTASYTRLPDSPLLSLIEDRLTCGNTGFFRYPEAKTQVSKGVAVALKKNDTARMLTYCKPAKNHTDYYAVSVADPKLLRDPRTNTKAMKILNYLGMRIHDCMSNGLLASTDLILPLSDFVDISLISASHGKRDLEIVMAVLCGLTVAHEQFARSKDASSAMPIENWIPKDKPLFRRFRVEDGRLLLSLNPDIDWKQLVGTYYAWVPSWIYSLPPLAYKLLAYSCKSMRRNAKKASSGSFEISMRALWLATGLYCSNHSNAQRREDFENALTAIEEAQRRHNPSESGTVDIGFIPSDRSCDPNLSIREFYNERLTICVSGQPQQILADLASHRASKIDAAAKAAERRLKDAKKKKVQDASKQSSKQEATSSPAEIAERIFDLLMLAASEFASDPELQRFMDEYQLGFKKRATPGEKAQLDTAQTLAS